MNHLTEFQAFLESKRHRPQDFGIPINFMPPGIFDYQEYVSERLIKKGRGAGYLDTGLGKTLIELIVATNYVRHTNKPVLILTPLAVAFQLITEAEKFGIEDV